MGLKNNYQILINGQDVFAKLKDKPVSINIIDESGFASDRIEIEINNADDIEIPNTDAEITAYINNSLMGRYKVTGIEVSSSNGFTLKMHGSGANWKTAFKTKQQRSFSQTLGNNTLLDIVQTIAENNDYQYKVADTLKGIQFEAIYQNEETDLQFLTRIAKKFNATLKLNNNYILLVEQSRNNLPTIQIENDQIINFNLNYSEIYNFQSVEISVQDIKTATIEKITAGNGLPKYVINRVQKDKAIAQRMAESKLKRLNQRKAKLQITLEGNAELMAESKLEINGMNRLLDGKWRIDRVNHSLGVGGFVSVIEGVISG